MAAKPKSTGGIRTSDISAFVVKQLKLLDLERNAEISESVDSRGSCTIKDLEKRGICVQKLHIISECTGLYGKHLVSFGHGKEKRIKDKGGISQVDKNQIVSHCLSNGDIVGVQTSSSELKEDNIASGIVTKVKDDAITVAFEDEFESSASSATFKLIKLCNDVTYKRLKNALVALNNTKKHSHLKEVLFHQKPLGGDLMLVKEEKFIPFDSNLNCCQTEAVKFALNQKEIAIIHGPPGTGKTTTVIEIIKQAVKCFNFKVLACAPSNVAVDNLVAKLVNSKIKIVRLGHPARVYPHLQKYSLDAVLLNSDSAEIVKGVRKDIQGVLEKIKKCRNGSDARKLRSELKYLKKELFERERKAIKSVLSSADVILSTTTSASNEGPLKHLNEEHFDLIIIDEAAQALEASCWIPLIHGNRCILAGDHQQLPPTIISQEAARKGLEVTLMERAIVEFGDPIVRMLTTQYRMNSMIMEWPSKQLYDDKLTADDSVGSHLLSDLQDVVSDENTSIPLLFIDTAGCCMYELKQESEESKGNEHEAQLVVSHVEALLKANVKEESIGIITPYNLQVELVRQLLSSHYPKLEIRSVDGFQGREKEAIIISLVRSNEEGDVGFLKEDRRINVAITRARRHLTVVGDSSTIYHHDFLRSFYDYVSDNGEVRSAQNYKFTPMTSNTDEVTNEFLKDFKTLNCNDGDGLDNRPRDKKYAGVNSLDLKIERDGVHFKGSKRRANIVESNPEKQEDAVGGECRSHDGSSQLACDDIGLNAKALKSPEYTKEAIEQMVADFVNSETEESLVFDPTMSSRGRFLVHELAEKYGLAHWSGGDGKDRCITIKKRKKKQCSVNDVAVGALLDEELAVVCPTCSKSIPKQNIQLHLLRCTKVESGGVKDDRCTSRKDVKKKIQSKVNKKEKKREEEEDVDALIAQFTKDDSTCSFDSCKISVLTLGQKCSFCVGRFCLKHGLAEAHGCGEAAKIDARKSYERTTQKARTRPLNNIQKNYVKKKLNEKIIEMEKKRTANSSKKK